MDPVHNKLTKCFAAVFPDLPAAEIPSASLGRVPNWDSLATINLIALIEEEFQIQISGQPLGEAQMNRDWAAAGTSLERFAYGCGSVLAVSDCVCVRPANRLTYY